MQMYTGDRKACCTLACLAGCDRASDRRAFFDRLCALGGRTAILRSVQTAL